MKQEITGFVSLKMNPLLTVRQCKYFQIGKVTTSELFTRKSKVTAVLLLWAVVHIQHVNYSICSGSKSCWNREESFQSLTVLVLLCIWAKELMLAAKSMEKNCSETANGASYQYECLSLTCYSKLWSLWLLLQYYFINI